MDKNKDLSVIDNNKLLEILNTLPNLTDEDRHDLSMKIISDDMEVRKQAIERMSKSQQAVNDFNQMMGGLSQMNKQGAYIKSKQTFETGSGKFEIEMKGGDRRIIIPVLVILGIIVIAVLFLLKS